MVILQEVSGCDGAFENLKNQVAELVLQEGLYALHHFCGNEYYFSHHEERYVIGRR